jgi:hypothetical protein
MLPPPPRETASPETCQIVFGQLLSDADETHLVTVSVRALARRLGYGRSTVDRALERKGTGYGYPTRYRVVVAAR